MTNIKVVKITTISRVIFLQVSCVNVETNEVVEVTSIARGVCKDISCIPDKKGVYRMELEFEYDPSSLRSVNTFKISGTEPTDVCY